MQRSIDRYQSELDDFKFAPTCPTITQIMSEPELIEILPGFDGWIIGDDPATEAVFRAGVDGRLKAAVKWGVGIDNVDIDGAERHGLKVANTPGMFGEEVADVAMGYLIALARQTFAVDTGVRSGEWPKPLGVSLRDKVVGIVGLGNIGTAFAKRTAVAGMRVIGYDPRGELSEDLIPYVTQLDWPVGIENADFIVLCCALNRSTRQLLNDQILHACKRGVRIVNVSRGSLVDETALAAHLETGHVHSAALEVFETEPLPLDSPLRQFAQCLFGSHNASNTREAVDRTSRLALRLLRDQLLAS